MPWAVSVKSCKNCIFGFFNYNLINLYLKKAYVCLDDVSATVTVTATVLVSVIVKCYDQGLLLLLFLFSDSFFISICLPLLIPGP